MAAGSIISLKLIINLRRGIQRFLQTIRPYQRRGAVHLIKILDLLRDLKVRRGVIQFLLHQVFTEHY